MCLSPINLPNSQFDGFSLAYRKQVDDEGVTKTVLQPLKRSNLALGRYSDSATSYTLRPCGTCAECLRKQQLQLIQRCLAESETNHILFCTNTYKNEALRYVSAGDRQLPVVDFHDFDNLVRFARINKVIPPFKYLVCSEYGHNFHRPHIHYLIFIPKRSSDTPSTPFEYQESWIRHMKLYWARNHGSRKNPVWTLNSQFIRIWRHGRLNSTYDCRAVVPSEQSLRLSPDQYEQDESNVAFYVTKYVLKFDPFVQRTQRWLRLNLSPEEYKSVWSQFRPQIRCSKFFGSDPSHASKIKDDIQHSLTQTDSPYPLYYLPDGKGVPLSRYYRSGRPLFRRYSNGHTIVCLPCHQHLSADSARKFIDKSTDTLPGSATHYFKDRNKSQLDSISDQFKRTQSLINDHNQDVDPILFGNLI